MGRGGTLNALAALATEIGGGDKLISSNVAIVHSGGDAKRSPLQCVTGKAWSNINCLGKKSNARAREDQEFEVCPLSLLLEEISRTLVQIRVACDERIGTVVIASSDVMLNLNIPESFVFPDIIRDSFSVVTVPESADVAKNHGVVVGGDGSAQDTVDVFIAMRYLQKPSQRDMQEAGAFISTGEDSDDNESAATLIDTGLIVANGTAFERLLRLLDNPIISCCTLCGLLKEKSSNPLRLELYSDILFSLAWHDQSNLSFEDYLRRLNIDEFGGINLNLRSLENNFVSNHSQYHLSLYEKALVELWKTFHESVLVAIACREGTFCHLGSSSELRDFILSSNINYHNSSADLKRKVKFCHFREEYFMQAHILSLHSCDSQDESMFCSNCSVVSSSKHVIGAGSVLDCSFVGGDRCDIGSGCILSDIEPVFGLDLVVPDDIMIQQIPLEDSWSNYVVSKDSPLPENSGRCCVLLTVGVHDNVKVDHETDDRGFCGFLWSEFFNGPINKNDVWDADCVDRSLWNARLFPVLSVASCEGGAAEVRQNHLQRDAATWFLKRDCPGSDSRSASQLIEEWKSMPRLSLSNILLCGDSRSLWEWKAFSRCALSSLLGTCGEASFSTTEGSCCLLRLTRVYSGTKSLISEVAFILSEMSQASDAACPALQRKACTLCLGLLIIRLCKPSISFVEDMGLCGDSLLMDSHVELLCSLIFKNTVVGNKSGIHLRQIYVAFDSCYQFLSSTTDQFSFVSLFFQYLSVLADQHTPSAALMQFLHAHIAINGICPISPMSIPRFLLLISSLAERRIVASSTHYSIRKRVERRRKKQEVLKLSFDTLSDCFGIIHVREPETNVEATNLARQNAINAAQDLVQLQLMCQETDGASDYPELLPVPCRQKPECLLAVTASAPFRIDLSGGWSDTPPITYEYNSCVVNIAVDIADGREPSLHQRGLVCTARFIEDQVIRLTTQTKLLSSFLHGCAAMEDSEYEIKTSEYTSLKEFDLSTPTTAQASDALLRACLVAMGVVDPSLSSSLSELLSKKCGGYGLHVTTSSRVPVGSGLGISSILMATVVRSVRDLFHCNALPGEDVCPMNNMQLIDIVANVEQLMKTGGGWQDQIGGIYGGLKVSRSNGSLPLRLSIDRLPLNRFFIQQIELRMYLIYTGICRIARNALLRVLSNLSQQSLNERSPSNTVAGIIDNANALSTVLAKRISTVTSVSQADDLIDEIATNYVRVYANQKKTLSSQSETDVLRKLRHKLEKVCLSMCPCGAGSGGFAVCFLRRGGSYPLLLSAVSDMNEISVHTIRINDCGIICEFHD